MKFRAITVATIATLLSVNTFALTQKKGVVESVNLEENTISITLNNGRTENLRLSESAKVFGAETIKAGQLVTLSVSGLKKEKPQFVSAEIISVNAESNTAVVREKFSGNVRTITFSDDVSVKGRVDTVAELTEGHIVKVRYASL